jgi:hypothetical protein
MPASLAMHLVENDTALYVNYEQLVGADARVPAEFANDAQRGVVASALFGSYGREIRYGVLSLSDRGLATYGDVFCTLRDIAIDERTSFLETNSYEFVKTHGSASHPPGYRSDWNNRAKLVAVKFAQSGVLRAGQGYDDWERKLVASDGKNRNLDEFVEAHIYGPFNVLSVEKMISASSIDRKSRRVVVLVLEAFRSRTPSA